MEPQTITAFTNEYILQKEQMSARHLKHIEDLILKDIHEAKLHSAKYRILINAVNDQFILEAAEKTGLDLNYEHIGENGNKTKIRELLIKNLLPIFDQTILNNFDKNFEILIKSKKSE